MPQPVRLRAKVEHTVDHAPGLRSLVLTPERPVPRFKPGQFLHLALDSWDPSAHWPDSRAFSIASAPESRNRLQVTVSEVGRFTARVMESNPGDTVWLKLPYGDFVVESRPQSPVVLVAGGTGVAPFVSLVTSEVALEGPVHLVYGVRNPDLLIYREALDAAAERNPLVTWQAFVEEGECDGAVRGRLSPAVALDAAAVVDGAVAAGDEASGVGSAAVFYLSGPPAMIADLSVGLAEAGVEPERIRVDAWA